MYVRVPLRECKNGRMSRTRQCIDVAYIHATPLAIDSAKTTTHDSATIIQTLQNINFLLTATVEPKQLCTPQRVPKLGWCLY